MDYQESLAWLEELNTFGIRLGLSRIERLAELLGHPERRYRTIHVTGTNGKGSVSAMLAAILRQAGRRTGLYTSPHLVSYTERCQLDGAEIGESDFARCLTEVRRAAEQMIREGDECPTQFEALTALAFLWFAGAGAEYAVIEVGLGGLLDSTNIITPVLSVITNVSLEHADRCDGTLEGVARHKAGIIKPQVPVVTGASDMPLEVIRRTAAEKKAPLWVLGEDFRAVSRGFDDDRQIVGFDAPDAGVRDLTYALKLSGPFQATNSALAVMAAALLRRKEVGMTETAVRAALAAAKWPGRFEDMSLPGQAIRVDGAHNPAGAAALAAAIDACYPDAGRVFLLGILGDKDVDGILRHLLRPGDRVVAAQPDSPRALTAAALAARLSGYGAVAEADLSRALETALSRARDGRLLVAAGSLYLIGPLRQLLLAKRESEVV